MSIFTRKEFKKLSQEDQIIDIKLSWYRYCHEQMYIIDFLLLVGIVTLLLM